MADLRRMGEPAPPCGFYRAISIECHVPSTCGICGFEEMFEMLGLLAMLRALLLHIAAEFGGLRLIIAAPDATLSESVVTP